MTPAPPPGPLQLLTCSTSQIDEVFFNDYYSMYMHMCI